MPGIITSKVLLTPEQVAEIEAAWEAGHVGFRKRSWWRKWRDRRDFRRQYRLCLKKSPKVDWNKLFYENGGR